MARYARIASGTVAEIVALPDTARGEDGTVHEIRLADVFHEDLIAALRPCPDPAVMAGWTHAIDGHGVDVFAAPVAALPQAAQLAAYAAARRFAVEVGGIVVGGAPIATDRNSQAMIGNAFAYVQASGAASVSYKTAAGFVTLSAEQIKAVALAVGAHVQACFKAEDTADAGINATPPTITAYAQVDAIFAALKPGA